MELDNRKRELKYVFAAAGVLFTLPRAITWILVFQWGLVEQNPFERYLFLTLGLPWAPTVDYSVLFGTLLLGLGILMLIDKVVRRMQDGVAATGRHAKLSRVLSTVLYSTVWATFSH